MNMFRGVMKTYSRTIKTVIVYVVVFLSIVVLLDKVSEKPTIESYMDQQVSVAVIDHDHSALSEALSEYLRDTQKLVEIEDDKDALQDALYFRKISYLIVVPEGFSKELEEGKEPTLSITKLPDATSSVFVDQKVQEFIRIIRGYYAIGLNSEEALNAALSNQREEVSVTLIAPEGTAEKVYDFAYFFQLLPYGLITILINLIGTVLIIFNNENIERRIRCSCIKPISRGLQMILAAVVVAIVTGGLAILVAFVRYGDSLVSSGMLGWILLNTGACILFSTGLSVLLGTAVKEKESLSGICTTLSLALCFLGGVYVSSEVMSEGVQKVSQFIPLHWYVKANDIICTSSELSGTKLNEVLFCFLVQVLFAVALFSVTLAVGKAKMRREA